MSVADHRTHVEIAAGLTPPAILLLGIAANAVVGMVRRGSRESLHTSITCIALAGAAVGALLDLLLINRSPSTGFSLYDGSLTVDRLSVFITMAACAIGGTGVLLLGPAYGRLRPHIGEAHALVMVAVLSTAIVGAAGEMSALALGVELLGVSLIGLSALAKTDERAVAGAMRMVVVNGAGLALLLYGLVILYGLTGRTDLAAVAAALGRNTAAGVPLALALALIVTGLTAMLAAAPLWQMLDDGIGSGPGAVAGVVAALSVCSAITALIRITAVVAPADQAGWTAFTAGFAAFTMGYGALRALRAADLRQLTVGLGIAQAGAVLVALVAQRHIPGRATSPAGVSASLILLVSVSASLLLAGAVIGILDVHGEGTALRDLSERGPAAAILAVVSIASLAGVPPTFAFIARVNALSAAAVGGYGWLAVVAAVTGALGILAGARAIGLVYASHSIDERRVADPLGEAPRSVSVAMVSLGALVVLMPLLLAPVSRLAEGAAGPFIR